MAVAYAAVAWLLIQIATQVFRFFETPNWAVRLVVLLLIIGFPVALILAWAYSLLRTAPLLLPRRRARKCEPVIG